MNCIKCHGATAVIDSRLTEHNTVVRRRHFCRLCSHKFTTYEHQELKGRAKRLKMLEDAVKLISNTKDDAFNQTLSAKIANDVLYKLFQMNQVKL
jgi:transcriptional regulator NrdR family protein